MAGVQKAKSIETRRRILEAAVGLMTEEGLASLQIRTIATKAGYSVGSVYKHFPDIDALIIEVNSLTLDDIRNHMAQALAQEDAPLERLKKLAHAYLEFADKHANRWRGLFDHHLPDGGDIPNAHKAQNAELLALIGGELARLAPSLDHEALAIRSRTCFAAVHGMVAFNMEGRFIGLSGESLQRELDFLVERLVLPTQQG